LRLLLQPRCNNVPKGGAINPGAHVGALLIPALPFVAPSSEVSLARIGDLAPAEWESSP